MADVADYRVIRDANFTIQTGGDIDRDFDFNLGTAVQLGQQSILQFFYVSSQNASNLRFRFSINGNSIRTINVTGNSFGTIHEVVGRDVLRGGNNNIVVTIIDGSGSVTISDIVLFVRSEV